MHAPTPARARRPGPGPAAWLVAALLLAGAAPTGGTPAPGSSVGPRFLPHAKPRLIVLTDLSNEPDDEESLVRLLVYSDQFDLEGLIAVTSNWLRQGPREDLIRRDLAAYAQVRPNLLKHAPAFPPVEQLRAVACSGQPAYGMAAVGPGRSSAGSRRIIEAVDRADDRPAWVSIWGGPNTLAQALWDVRASRAPAAVDQFVTKLRVYAISDQDDFAARMDWCAADEFAKANHSPRPVLDGDRSTDVLLIPARAGSTVELSAAGMDAGDDGRTVKVTWRIYSEAGTVAGAALTRTSGLTTGVILPAAGPTGTVHAILQAEDDGTPPLFAYRRAIIEVTP